MKTPLLCLSLLLVACGSSVPEGWETYDNTDAGFSVSYPADVDFDIRVDLIEGLDTPMGYNEQTAKINRLALSKGNFGGGVDFALPSSQMVRSLGSVNAQDFGVLSRFEVCDVAFDRILYFFHNEHQIVLTLRGDRDALTEESSDYLKTYEPDCGDYPMWHHDKQDLFYAQLKLGRGGDKAQLWYDTFDDIVETVELR
ncbi:MAG: hypothetical protein HOG89_01745 [Candidatus Peribacter sp.]|jgi:hypothetical protein|nr:hypothetical protein [Candidatus Peribacter sp.]MBT4392836.1 hypothetical protein [Candidatus Peribacter sp.]MBT4601467.1 hypothetical protein [Candidatus Peribacter sp.]MBT5148784.1 hypothetical protein [Candidatus Peribacter sp.]MBT5637620.1 hypothetical protein [Candidatus Peribacter sp.]